MFAQFKLQNIDRIRRLNPLTFLNLIRIPYRIRLSWQAAQIYACCPDIWLITKIFGYNKKKMMLPIGRGTFIYMYIVSAIKELGHEF